MTDDDQAPSWAETAARATLAAIPYVGGTLQVVYEDVRARSAAKAKQTITDIVDVTGEQALVRRLADEPRVEALFVNAVDAALRTGLDAKRRLLSRAVAAAVMDDALLDEGQLITDVLAQLDVPHVRALKRMADEWEATADDDPEDVSWGNSAAFSAEPIPVRAALVRTGTAIVAGTLVARKGRNRQRGITDFGIHLVAQLQEEGFTED